MPLTPSAELLAQQLRSLDYVEIYAHHDADGIAAASLLCTALSRIHIPFHLHIRSTITAETVPGDHPVLLCDFGSSLSNLPESAMVIDHHFPSFRGRFHLNPRLHGIDGDRELSTSGAAYLVAQKLGDNRDLAGLALLGIIGDRQEWIGYNREILHDGIGNGVISTKKGFRLTGHDLYERLFLSIDPFLPSVTGNEAICRLLSEMVDPDTPVEEDSLLLTRLILEVGEEASADALLGIFGEIYMLEREVVTEASTLAALIDASGKSGRGGLAASLCLGDPAGIAEAWDIFSAFRQRVIQGYHAAEEIGQGWWRLDDPAVISDIADILSRDLVQTRPIVVLGDDGDLCRVSARSPPGIDLNLDHIMRTAAAAVSGGGGGHARRAGATIPQGREEAFQQAVMEAMGSC